MKHKYSIYAYARALMLQHNFDWDVALLSVCYYYKIDPPKHLYNGLKYILMCKHIPVLAQKEAEILFQPYANRFK